MQYQSGSLVAVTNLREFFHDSVQTALRQQHVAVDDHTEHYVVNVLTMFARTEELYEPTPEGARLKPLALMLAEAAEAPRRSSATQRCGGSATSHLFIAGFFAQSFARKLVDIDYHIAMGGRAYGTLADNMRDTHARPGVRRRVPGAGAEIPAARRRAQRRRRDVVHAYRSRHPAAVRDLAEDRQPARVRDPAAARRRARACQGARREH